MRSDGPARFALFVGRAALAAVALGFIVQYVQLAIVRAQYPFELEWMEGSMVDHVRRVLVVPPAQ